MESSANNPGPIIYLTGGIHGDEVGGPIVIHEIFKRLNKYPLLKGSIIALPLINTIGFKNINRKITLGMESKIESFDLNRAFPGNSNGNQASKLAAFILQTITKSKPTLVLDLHNDWINSIPLVLFDYKSPRINNSVYNLSKKYALRLGFPVLLESAESKQPTSLSANLLKHKIPALTLELGGSTTRSSVAKIDDVQDSVKAIWDLLASFGMVKPIKQKFKLRLPRQITSKILNYDYVKATKSGLAVYLLKPGAFVKNGQPIAHVYDLFGQQIETLKAKKTGIFLGHSDYSAAYPGAELISLGIL